MSNDFIEEEHQSDSSVAKYEKELSESFCHFCNNHCTDDELPAECTGDCGENPQDFTLNYNEELKF